jgi:RNA polymerase sigma-70 factor (ECF subfamily)
MNRMQLDDAAAVQQARDGDEEGFRVLVERHSRGVYCLAFRMTGRAEDAEDVVQETFIRAFRQLSRFEARANFATWLYRIGYNCAVDYMRSRRHRETPEDNATLDAMGEAGGAAGADTLVFAGEIHERVQLALGELSEKERAAFLMRHHEGCSIEEIGAALGMKTNATKHSIFRAVRKMRAALAEFVESGVRGSES